MATQTLPYEHLGKALATDYFFVREQFSDEEWTQFIATRRFVDNEVLPAINEYWERAELPWPLMRRPVPPARWLAGDSLSRRQSLPSVQGRR